METKAMTKEPKSFLPIKELIQMICSYALKWPLVLDAVRKTAHKEPSKKKVEESAERAYNTI